MADTLLFANNVRTTLAASVTAGASSISVTEGGDMPSPDVYEYFVVTVKDLSSGSYEIMHCTGRTGNTLSVDRAQEGTVALPFSEGDEVSMNLTAGMLEYIRDL